jgi:hypothetical protein
MSDPELFVVRIWRQLASGFRASVRRVDGDETHHFSRPEEITCFLSAPGRAERESDAELPRTEP